MAKLNMVQAINLGLKQEMAKDDSVVMLGEDVGVDGGVFRVTDGLQEIYGEDRVIDTPLAESAIVGSAIGMSMAGMKPVAEMQFSGFSYLAIHQMEGHASRYRSRTHGVWTCPMVLRMPYGGGVRALEHHSESREVLWAHNPGLKVVIPSTPRSARALIVAAIRDPDPVVFMEPKHSYRAFKEEVPDQEEVLPIGKARIIQEGTDVTLIAWGAAMRTALKAAKDVGTETGKSVEIIDLTTIAPMDTETIVASVKKTGRCVVVQEAVKSFGPASEIIARINDHALMYLEAPVARVTGYDLVTPNFYREKMYIPTVERVADALHKTITF